MSEKERPQGAGIVSDSHCTKTDTTVRSQRQF